MTDRRRRPAMPARVSRFRVGAEQYVVVSWPAEDGAGVALTPAERAVAELVAAGKTNAQIAEARGTSVRTVANQVASLLEKLGVPSRQHVARSVGGRRRDD